jgi:hypothetical protein
VWLLGRGAAYSEWPRGKICVMKDAIFIVAILIFFGASVLYVYGCERLK